MTGERAPPRPRSFIIVFRHFPLRTAHSAGPLLRRLFALVDVLDRADFFVVIAPVQSERGQEDRAAVARGDGSEVTLHFAAALRLWSPSISAQSRETLYERLSVARPFEGNSRHSPLLELFESQQK